MRDSLIPVIIRRGYVGDRAGKQGCDADQYVEDHLHLSISIMASWCLSAAVVNAVIHPLGLIGRIRKRYQIANNPTTPAVIASSIVRYSF